MSKALNMSPISQKMSLVWRPAYEMIWIVVFLWIAHPTVAYSLTGKRALVTGASGGIGRGLALELARQGCQILVHYNEREVGAQETSAQIALEGGSCAGVVQCDFRHLADMRVFQRRVDEIWPEGYDILINNAGIIGKLAMEDDDDEFTHWNDVMSVNLHAPRCLSHWAVPRIKARANEEGGVILHVSSVHGEKSNEYMAAYAASKAALDSLTQTMAMEYAPDKIRVNAIAPGVTVVERTAQAFADPQNQQPWLDQMLVGRLGTVEDVAQASLPLLTNDWITGTVWKVDGGIMARGNYPKRERPLPPGKTC